MKYDLVILGGGVSGKAVLALAEKLHQTGVIVTDSDTAELPESALIVASPGVLPLKSHLYQLALQSGREFIGEMEYGFRHIKIPVLAITGTNGKTTTTELTTHLLNQLGLRAVAAGNIGLPLSSVAAEPGDAEIVVLEVSNFQLELAPEFSPRAAVLLNLASDHEDRYRGGFAEYCAVKRRIFDRVAPENRICGLSFADAPHRVQIAEGKLLIDGVPEVTLAETRLASPHNAENLAAAAELLLRVLPREKLSGPAFREAVRSFHPGEHRLEIVAEKDGVRYINDSKATNPSAVVAAVRSCGNARCVLLLGGSDKGMNFAELLPILPQLRCAVLYGQAEERLFQTLADKCPVVRCGMDFACAVREAVKQARPGDCVMLSPACASFDLFHGYEERGRRFRDLIREII